MSGGEGKVRDREVRVGGGGVTVGDGGVVVADRGVNRGRVTAE